MLAQQFLLEIRKKFSVDDSSLTDFGKEVAAAMPTSDENIHPILTLPNARKLVEASIIEGVEIINRTIEKVSYYLQTYARSFISYYLKKIAYWNSIAPSLTG
jgi:hypothetical protein